MLARQGRSEAEENVAVPPHRGKYSPELTVTHERGSSVWIFGHKLGTFHQEARDSISAKASSAPAAVSGGYLGWKNSMGSLVRLTPTLPYSMHLCQGLSRACRDTSGEAPVVF